MINKTDKTETVTTAIHRFRIYSLKSASLVLDYHILAFFTICKNDKNFRFFCSYHTSFGKTQILQVHFSPEYVMLYFNWYNCTGKYDFREKCEVKIMDSVIQGFLARNLPQFADRIFITLTGGGDAYTVRTENSCVYISAGNYVAAFSGLYSYLKKYCRVQLSWCGNREIKIDDLVMFEGEMTKKIEQKYRVYMNYCTLDYSMCWWGFERWEKEIDFMAMNGINMPLCVVGTEAVWYETLLQFGFSEKEALSTISGPAFWAWHLMTNIESYQPPQDIKYVNERMALGKKITERYLEFGMQPIQQGFSGHVPMLLKKKYPRAKILPKSGWCGFSNTAQLDPIDPLFHQFGTAYLQNLERLFGNHHFLACDPFHEGTPPKPWPHYLRAVGKAINRLYAEFDKGSVWVMQSWSLRKHIVKAVPKDRLLILDLNSTRTPANRNLWGYPVVAGMLHNFGGKNAMQGMLRLHCQNVYKKLKDGGANVVGSGMFMEGIEQNPVIYDLQFELLTATESIDWSAWLNDYIARRYKGFDNALRKAWELMLETCYSDSGYKENMVGSTLAARPQMMPKMCGACCETQIWYDTKKLEKALSLFASVSEKFSGSDGYQYDLCDLTRQVLSNRFHDRQMEYQKAYKAKQTEAVKQIAAEQLDLMLDVDALLSHRSELCLARWICDSHDLATDDAERSYFDFNARTLITLWGDITSDVTYLYDYAWREWHGLIKEYYYVRWQKFYKDSISALESGKKFDILDCDTYGSRAKYRDSEFGRTLNEFERAWGKTYSEYARPHDSDVIGCAAALIAKWKIQ